MRRIIQCSYCVLGVIFFQLLVLCSAGSEKTARRADDFWTISKTPVYPAYACDTVPVSDTFDFYVSNQGLNSNSGTSTSAPKLSIENISSLINTPSTVNRQISIGLGANSKFREELDISKNNIRISSFGLQGQNNKKTAQLTGMDVVTDWKATQGKTNTYEYTITHSLDLTNPNYNYLFVAEIDTTQEKLFPVSAVKYLPLVSSPEQCEASPGSFSIAALTRNPITIYIHATQGVPGKNRYRYEVVKRPYNFYSFYNDNCTFENLFLQSSGHGYGMLGAGKNTYVQNVTFQGGGTHHAVIKSGTVDHSLFLPGPKGLADEIALVFYQASGMAERNKISNVVFLDIKDPVFTHTDGLSNYRSLTIDSVYAFADTLYATKMVSADNIDSVFIANSYSTGYRNFWVGTPPYIAIKNTVLNKISEPVIFLGSGTATPCRAEISNSLITTNGNDANQPNQPPTGFLFYQDATSLKVSNTIFYGHSTWHKLYETVIVYTNTINNKLEASNNIYICDVNPENYLRMTSANNLAGKGNTSNIVSDYNVYIILRGNLSWTAYPNSPQGDGNIFSLKDWQDFTGQDQHSITIDLRNNPAGLKAIFTDPENGNWTFVQSPQADSIKKLNAGMLTPPLYYPFRPIYEDALDHTLPGGLSYLKVNQDQSRQVKLEWKMIREPNLAYFAIEKGTDISNYIQIGRVESMGRYQDNLYSFAQSDTSSSRIYYRLRCMNTDSSFSYSAPVFVDPLKKDSIINGIGGAPVSIIIYPNPVQTTLMVEHPARDQAEISIYDYTGRRISTTRVSKRAFSTLLSLENLPGGNYIIKWTSGQEKKAVPFMKVK